jgi:hypothetical protein
VSLNDNAKEKLSFKKQFFIITENYLHKSFSIFQARARERERTNEQAAYMQMEIVI